ncbi:hypothetical protein [Melghirimyces algeriensis]|uniref:YqxM protein n=1 Tax=Melghirimyces algeriensis TaxID=910412 RepID=A0A521D0K7_9BACL|nr:hypothetical protein [Melghirimyces algeriensis]SMO65233.1 hypothetical protein SAMN06264849_10521 [Melghirimyces algeriensis]
MRTAALTLIVFLLTFTVAPAAFAETSQETAASSLEAVYYTKDNKHLLEVTLPGATQLKGNWVVTLNGSYEQRSAEDAEMNTFVAEYEDLNSERSYQVNAVFYGKNGAEPIDLDACFQLENPATTTSKPVQLKDCGLNEVAEKAKKSNAETKDSKNTEDGNSQNSGNAEQETAPVQDEEPNTLQNMNSSPQEQGDSSADSPLASTGLQLFSLGFTLLSIIGN